MEVKNDKNNEAVLAWKKKKEKKKNKIHTDNGTLIDIVHLSITFECSRVILRELFQTERFVPRTQSARRDNLLNVLYCIITSISLSLNEHFMETHLQRTRFPQVEKPRYRRNLESLIIGQSERWTIYSVWKTKFRWKWTNQARFGREQNFCLLQTKFGCKS